MGACTVFVPDMMGNLDSLAVDTSGENREVSIRLYDIYELAITNIVRI